VNLPLRVTLVWFGFFALAFVNGALREVAIKRLVREPWAHQVSVLTGIALFTAYLWLLWDRTSVRTVPQALGVGAYWMALTVLAETFVVSRWIAGQSWDKIRGNYGLLRGNLWPVVVIWVGMLPLLMLRIRG
jgi:hypothetical protein